MSHTRRSGAHRLRLPVRGAALIACSIAVGALATTVAQASPAQHSGLLGSLGTGSLSDGPDGGPDADANLPDGFDLQAHRGGLGETTEESRRAFEKAVELGVTTLELDIGISADGVPVVWHDPVISAKKCRDTAPAADGDPMFPYIGDALHDLTWDQLQTLSCDVPLPNHPDAEVVEGNTLIRLRDVFAVVQERNADVHFNIETKIEADRPGLTASPQEFVDTILSAVRDAGVTDKVMIQSFDWRSLPLVRAAEPSIPLVMLWNDSNWFSGSEWTGPVDYDAVDGDVLAAADALGVEVLSPSHTLVDAPLIAAAHDAGYRVVPWTVDDAARLGELIDLGVDGLITDYPTRLRAVMAERGMALPEAFPAQ
ncbi:glycerophosphodiester phosphodiesterase family protein [Tomitella cavernea]|uniref:Glycerophosphodiester phosphodiesterase family protein n=1 Tax=Tomitella cavernea TaxID=1387982 RepID=A0ABP9CKA0_9ACTN|nr:glycerophosphodiester phosphodiesterase family protein [Tomitella cavernea]